MNTATRPGKIRKGKSGTGAGRSTRPAGATAAGNDADRFSDPMQSIGYLCRINFRGFARELEHRIARYGVSSGQWRSLRVLWDEDNITQRELSDRVGATEATTVPMIRTLVRDGFVVRRQDADDRRKVRIVLTPKARRLQRKLMPFVGEVNDLAVRGISAADQAVVRRVLAEIHRNLSALP
jgi:DNA-binding MarR family transcriptional regulator